MNLYLVEAKVQLIHLLRNFRLSIFNILIFTIHFVSGWSLRVHLHMLIAALLCCYAYMLSRTLLTLLFSLKPYGDMPKQMVWDLEAFIGKNEYKICLERREHF